jgi:DNA recombination protein RmuC
MNEIIIFVAGGGLGAGAGWFLAQSRADAKIEAASDATNAVIKASVEAARLQTDAAVKSSLAAAEAAFLKTSAVAGQQERDAMLTLTGERISAIVGPLKNDVSRLQSYVERVDKERSEAYSAISTTIAQIMDQHKMLGEATTSLSSQSGALVAALKNPTTRGRWGEFQLRRVVEMAGMVEWCDFAEQTTLSMKGEGRPDLTVRLPEQRCIHIDAKTPLAAYLAALEEPDAGRQAELRRDYAKAVKSHVDELVRRSYHTSEGSVGFCVMYVPGEAFLQAAMAEAPELLEYAASREIYLCGPMTLMPLLRSYALGWREIRQEERAKEIAELGSDLHERLKVFIKHFGGIGAALGQAIGKYNDAVGSFESRVIPQGRRMAEAASLHGEHVSAPAQIDTIPRTLSLPELLPGVEVV